MGTTSKWRFGALATNFANRGACVGESRGLPDGD